MSGFFVQFVDEWIMRYQEETRIYFSRISPVGVGFIESGWVFKKSWLLSGVDKLKRNRLK
jgi:hypothetical protein